MNPLDRALNKIVETVASIAPALTSGRAVADVFSVTGYRPRPCGLNADWISPTWCLYGSESGHDGRSVFIIEDDGSILVVTRYAPDAPGYDGDGDNDEVREHACIPLAMTEG